MTTPAATLAQRKRQLVADELTRAALELLADGGFEAVTVDEIAAAAGVSKRTFFRYFASKEDVVVRFLAGLGAAMREELAARPAAEPPSVALRHAVWCSVAACAGHEERARRVVRLILTTPALLARFLERQAQWRDALAAELAARLGLDPAAELYPQLAADMALAAFHAVLQRWSGADGDGDGNGGHGDGGGGGGVVDAAALTDRSFAVIAPALDAVVRTGAPRS
ncbi:TetR family transcriptional regulator [Kitasatospora xanthocidica]|uniref:TetR family transcriptional regulator n=1 Tax=Kitasatospora xanthocidica TaxID=83382 RepID=UPI00167AB8AB|nr:TetR family transcriptional regulator [Kitasatospora xanthocidica]GHF86252.1 TetR family transcriptional regulator [Kitasatospora xanthocidica]